MNLEKKCKDHWKQLGITNPETLRSHISGIFERHTNQQHVVVDLYRLVLPDWDQIEKLKGHPQVGMEFSYFIFHKFQDFDREHHPNCMPAGAWLNWGFSTNRDLDPWRISFENCEVVLVEKTVLQPPTEVQTEKSLASGEGF